MPAILISFCFLKLHSWYFATLTNILLNSFFAWTPLLYQTKNVENAQLFIASQALSLLFFKIALMVLCLLDQHFVE
jgi:hypothetical protein